jgi:hypothetical protein
LAGLIAERSDAFFMAKIFYCGGSSVPLRMLRAVIPVADLSGVLSEESPKYVGKSFPKMKQADSSCTVIEVVPGEEPWKAGFYRAAKGPLEFEGHLQSLQIPGVRSMRFPFCILSVLGDLLDGGELRFVETAQTLEAARQRIRALAKSKRGQYVIYNEETGERFHCRRGRLIRSNFSDCVSVLLP